MKVERQKAGPCRVKLFVKADAEETRPDHERIIGRYVSHGRVPGFRPGKAPRPIIERQYQREIAEDVRGALVARFHRQAIEQEQLRVAAVVDVADILFTPETGISFVLVVDTAPEFKLPKYERIPIKVNEIAVAEEQVESQLGQLRLSLTSYEETDGAVAAGDMALIDYAAVCDGRPMAETVADSGRLAAGTDFWARAAAPEFIPGLALALVGLKAGDNREIPVAFPADFPLEGLRGIKATYQVTVKSVRRAVPPADDAIAGRLGFENIAALRARLRENLELDAKREEESRQRREIQDYLLKRCDFDLPQSLVAEETRRVLRRILGELDQSGRSREYVEQNREHILGAAAATARDQLRLGFILAAIADERKIEAPPEELDRLLDGILRERRRRGEKNLSPRQLREQMEAGGHLDRLRRDIRNARTLDWLLAEARRK